MSDELFVRRVVFDDGFRNRETDILEGVLPERFGELAVQDDNDDYQEIT